MRSLIILEVEHGEDIDPLTYFVAARNEIESRWLAPATITNYTVRVDLPPCFVLDSGNTESKE